MESIMHDLIFFAAYVFGTFTPDNAEVMILPGELWFRGDGGATTGAALSEWLYGKGE